VDAVTRHLVRAALEKTKGHKGQAATLWSYLTNNSVACANCHIMQDHYDV
jgi:hypothetical protein